jgi:hypothetical protein
VSASWDDNIVNCQHQENMNKERVRLNSIHKKKKKNHAELYRELCHIFFSIPFFLALLSLYFISKLLYNFPSRYIRKKSYSSFFSFFVLMTTVLVEGEIILPDSQTFTKLLLHLTF